jgi:hypothetical protein
MRLSCVHGFLNGLSLRSEISALFFWKIVFILGIWITLFGSADVLGQGFSSGDWRESGGDYYGGSGNDAQMFGFLALAALISLLLAVPVKKKFFPADIPLWVIALYLLPVGGIVTIVLMS